MYVYTVCGVWNTECRRKHDCTPDCDGRGVRRSWSEDVARAKDTRMTWSVKEIEELATRVRALADELDAAVVKAKDSSNNNCADDSDVDARLSVVASATLAGNAATALKSAMDSVRPHAGDAFVDIDAARGKGRRGAGSDEDADDEARDEDDGFVDMFDEEGKPRRGYVPKKGHTLPGMNDALGELRGVLKKVGVSAPREGEEDIDPISSGAEADGEASEVENSSIGEKRAEAVLPPPKADKPQWMIELAAKNAAKRAANAAQSAS